MHTCEKVTAVDLSEQECLLCWLLYSSLHNIKQFLCSLGGTTTNVRTVLKGWTSLRCVKGQDLFRCEVFSKKNLISQMQTLQYMSHNHVLTNQMKYWNQEQRVNGFAWHLNRRKFYIFLLLTTNNWILQELNSTRIFHKVMIGRYPLNGALFLHHCLQ